MTTTMLALDARTLLMVGFFSYTLMGCLTLVAGDTRRDHAEVIERHARQQMDLIDELLEFSRSELADLALEPVPGYLHAFLDELAEQAALTCERRGNQLERDFADTLPARVVADFHRLRQVRKNHGRLPVLLYSVLPPQRPHGLDTGVDFDAALLKPAGSAVLLGCVTRLLELTGNRSKSCGHAGTV